MCLTLVECCSIGNGGQRTLQLLVIVIAPRFEEKPNENGRLIGRQWAIGTGYVYFNGGI